MKGNVQIFPGIAQRISMATRWKREEKDTFIQDVIGDKGGQAKIIDMRKKFCIYVGLRNFKDTVSYRSL